MTRARLTLQGEGGEIPHRGAPAERRLTPITINVPDAAKIAGLGQSTIWQLIKDGKLDSRKVAGRRVIPYRALQALMLGESE
jgi:hypothetical protein